MRRARCWQVLGIDPTGDIAAIRRAYAIRLKAIDSDRDAEGFAALRAARDEAMALAVALDAEPQARLPVADEQGGDAPAVDDGPRLITPVLALAALPSGTLAARHAAPAPKPWRSAGAPATVRAGVPLTMRAPWGCFVIPDTAAPIPAGLVAPPRDIDEDYGALYDLLAPEDSERERGFPEPALAEALVAHFERVLADPRLGEIEFLDSRERWIAQVLAMAWPTSEPLVARAVAHFGWGARAGEIGQSDAVAYLVDRVVAQRFQAEVATPGHRLHGAWKELTKPANEHSRRSFGVRAGRVGELLAAIRNDHPTLLPMLDSWRVSMWEHPYATTSSTTWIWVVLFALVTFARVVGGSGGAGSTTSPPQVPWEVPAQALAADDDEAITTALQRYSVTRGLTAGQLETANPKLLALLRSNVGVAREEGKSPTQFAENIASVIDIHVARGGKLADPALLADFARFRIDQGKAMRKVGWEACAGLYFDDHGAPPKMPKDLVARRDALLQRVLLSTDAGSSAPAAAGASGTVTVSGAAVDQIARRTGVSGDRLSKAMLGKGTAKDLCTTSLGTLEVALERPPPESARLLRGLLFGG